MRAVRRILRRLAAVLAVVLVGSPAARAGESSLEDAPAPEAVDEIATPIERGFEKEDLPRTLFPRLKQVLEDQPPFLRDTSLVLHLRSYWLEQDPPDAGEREAIAYGDWLAYESGEWEDLFSVGATFYTTQRLYGPSEKDGTRLLGPGQPGFTPGQTPRWVNCTVECRLQRKGFQSFHDAFNTGPSPVLARPARLTAQPRRANA